MSTHRVLAGRYEVGEVIGFGGTADVHLGRDLGLDRPVAIKVLRRDLARDPLFHSRFRREAKSVAGLNHRAIVEIYDTGYEEVDGGSARQIRVPFIVMEHIAGRSLRDVVRIRRLKLDMTIYVLAEILSALDFSHRAGVIHRDIKPANVMITPEGAVKVVDFGIARASGDPAATLTQAQVFLGTPSYLSPEQARGETADARSDLYSAGCLLYELFTGRPPFVGDDPVCVAYQHVHEEPLRVSDYDPDLTPAVDALLVKALAKAREDRFQDAQTFADALRSAARGLGQDVPMTLAMSTQTGTAALAC